MIRQSLVLLLAVATTILGWRLLDGQIDAATFLRTAFTDAPPPVVKPRKEQIERDFAMLSGKVNYVRTYRAVDGGDIMPEIAARYGLKLVPGAWIYSADAEPSPRLAASRMFLNC